ncbi:MAG: hypothetical protein Q4B43_05615 [Bacteroidota bacterium]|nr:hypothetical protein [Bacteroidota bacterium]
MKKNVLRVFLIWGLMFGFSKFVNVLQNCRYTDSTYIAKVTYYNPKTDYTGIYTLDVKVQNCKVVQINFPKGGWVDEDHIRPTELNSNGYCIVHGEGNKTYKVELIKN